MTRLGLRSTDRNDENITKTKRAIDEDRRKNVDQTSVEINVSCSTFMTMHHDGSTAFDKQGYCASSTLLIRSGSVGLILLFPRMKRILKGKRFSDVDEVKENIQTAFNSILP
ncbi:uncharacterized protein TNCV_150131 [Trichonephila clavipes]|nr:uncharacterized protein TNCV_150131 [Trichonephila clavipes]